ncbi:hypothetical protein EV361DRAFT_910527 [Lentinula raphanica]|uniref:Cytochrome b561 domain-containing protein n=1 Tax=Lentinula raphanica TaxID=153919 RepID=A0AA38PE20_9AGAR|nr:hypothetical protein C8R42DRAFT_744446 [Lentinula raphanica]KAJ3764477.1 hypothetical protein EV360DRAFT_77419 [Lentinula raphanica]KAJ3774711.1 hypothetical protein FB446DRAFT_843818 [Lentinula raphanica]KAJ3826669.1 hypothetical protein F5880DRAFT_1610053 [Lentinula raphanica]KAJ3841209.1 hypothetical protein F5878DRAFT_658731 [Lentinula raphanica]
MPASTGPGYDYHDTLIIAHAVFASLAALITAPAAILVARYFRSRTWWFKAHIILQIVTVAFTILLFVLSTVAVASGGHGTQFVGPKKDPHHDLGLSIVILLWVEAIFGVAAHYTHTAHSVTEGTFPTIKAKKSPLRHLHAWYGIFVAGLLYAGIKTGIDEWNMVADSGTLVPRGIEITFWVIFALEIAAYVSGWFLEAFRGGRKSNIIREHSTDAEKDETPSI